MTGAVPPTRLRALAASAMLGTDRSGSSTSPEDLLRQAAVLGAQARAGFKPRQLTSRLPACPPDARPVVGAAPMATLTRILAEPDAGLILEWSELAHAKGVRVADSAAPALIDWWSRQPTRSERVFSVLGTRGAWLASLNQAWRKPFAGSEIPPDAEEIWQTGTASERAAVLLTIRRNDPGRALALIQSTWSGDGAEERRRFIEVCTERCSMADEPFLEAALDDKSKVVRRAVASVLALLPGSRFMARMNERAKAMIVVEGKRGLLKRTVKARLSPPQDFDRTWERDGIEEQAASGIGKRAWWMRQILSQADLSLFPDALGNAPAGVLEAIADDDFVESALDGFWQAAGKAGNAEWCAAILRHRLTHATVDVAYILPLFQNLTPEQREPLLLEAMEHKTLSAAERWAILARSEHRWSPKFSAAALKLLHAPAGKDEVWRLLDSVDRVSRWIAPEHAEDFAATVSAILVNETTQSFRKSVDRARLRAEMRKEFGS